MPQPVPIMPTRTGSSTTCAQREGNEHAETGGSEHRGSRSRVACAPLGGRRAASAAGRHTLLLLRHRRRRAMPHRSDLCGHPGPFCCRFELPGWRARADNLGLAEEVSLAVIRAFEQHLTGLTVCALVLLNPDRSSLHKP